MKKQIFDLYLMPSINVNSKWIIDANVKPIIIKLLEENFCGLGLGKRFLDAISNVAFKK